MRRPSDPLEDLDAERLGGDGAGLVIWGLAVLGVAALVIIATQALTC